MNTTAANSSTTNFADDETKTMIQIAVLTMISFCLLAILMNILVLLTSHLIRNPINPTLKLTYSLAGADIWASLVIAAGLYLHTYRPTTIDWQKYRWQDCASYALEALRLGGILTSVLHLLALAGNHYKAIANFDEYKSWSQRVGHWIDVTIFLLWICPPLLYFVVFAAFVSKTFAPTISECSPDFLGTLGFRVLVFSTTFLPLFVLCLLYAKIALLLKRLQSHMMLGRRSSESAELTSRRSSVNQNRHRSPSFVQRKKSVFKTGLIIVATSLLAWLPAVVFLVVTCSVCAYPYTTLHSFPRLLYSLTIPVNVLMILKGLVNPFVYAVRIPEIKEAILTFFRDHAPILGRGRSSSDRDEYGERKNVHAL